MQGWIYKRVWYPKGEYKHEEWVYQSEGASNHDSFLNAYRDLCTMKAIYYGTDLEKIQKSQEEVGQDLIKRYEARALAELTKK